MTNLKTVEAPATIENTARVEQPPPVVKTQEFPAIAATEPWEPEGPRADAVPSVIADGDITVPVESSIETALTFEAVRRESMEDDGDGNKDDDGTS